MGLYWHDSFKGDCGSVWKLVMPGWHRQFTKGSTGVWRPEKRRKSNKRQRVRDLSLHPQSFIVHHVFYCPSMLDFFVFPFYCVYFGLLIFLWSQLLCCFIYEFIFLSKFNTPSIETDVQTALFYLVFSFLPKDSDSLSTFRVWSTIT